MFLTCPSHFFSSTCSKEYFEISWATLRALVEPAVAEKVYFLHSKYLTKAKLVIGEATAVSENAVTLKDGQSIPFDYLVIASGSIPRPTVSLAEKIAFVKSGRLPFQRTLRSSSCSPLTCH